MRAMSFCCSLPLLLGLVSPAAVLEAQAGGLSQAEAAARFDEGVRSFRDGRYEAAARAFVAADDAVPSVDALENALAAAVRGGDDVLTARVAARALQRPEIADEMRSTAEGALQEVEPRLARIELKCTLPACSLQLDGEFVSEGIAYASPGSHEVRVGPGLASAEAVIVQCKAGHLCPVTVGAVAARALGTGEVVAQPADRGEQPERVAVAPETPASLSPVRDPAPHPAAGAVERGGSQVLPLAVFIGSSIGALTFAGLTTYSGLRAFEERDADDYSERRTQSWATRSNYLFAGTVLLSAAALATAIWWVDFGPPGEVAVSLSPSGDAFLTTHHRF